jgi:hypothetical protein
MFSARFAKNGARHSIQHLVVRHATLPARFLARTERWRRRKKLWMTSRGQLNPSTRRVSAFKQAETPRPRPGSVVSAPRNVVTIRG